LNRRDNATQEIKLECWKIREELRKVGKFKGKMMTALYNLLQYAMAFTPQTNSEPAL
jgi:hypothetical protein